MNRYEKSLERIKKNLCPSADWTVEDHMQLKTIFDALEKQIPKNIEIKMGGVANEYCYYFCPICGKHILSRRYHDVIAGIRENYCSRCGQALDWSDSQ